MKKAPARALSFVLSLLSAAMLLLVICSPASAQTTIHVDDDAPNDPGPGDTSISDPLEDGTHDHPFDAIQEGIDAAADGDTVLVADGTYNGTGNRDIRLFGKPITVRSENGPDGCTLDCGGSYTVPHRGFRLIDGEGRTTVIEGFEIVNGYDVNSVGGGILCDQTSPVIRANRIEGCVARHGGGVYTTGGAPLVTGNTIRNCAGSFDEWYGKGGGICCEDGGAAEIAGNVIDDNDASSDGGGIYSANSSSIIRDNTITNNVSWGGFGGGIFCGGETGHPVIDGNLVHANRADPVWGSWGGGLCLWTGVSAIVSGNTILQNQSADNGGGIACYETASSTMIVNNLVVANTVPPGSAFGTYGGGISIESCSPSLAGNTIAGNSAENGGGLYVAYSSSPTMTNSILWNNDALAGDQIRIGYEFGSGTELTAAYSNIQGGEAAVSVVPGDTLLWGPGNIDADPLFVSGPDGDYYLSQTAAGQGADSPCVDAGQNLAAGTCWTTADGIECLSGSTTRTDTINDQGTADMGFHYPALGPVSAWLSCQPSSGVLPFTTTIALGLENTLPGVWRQVAGRIDVVLGNGTAFPNWRAGHLVLGPGEWYGLSWGQLIPEILPAYDENRFTLVAADVTPAPYNQPPYPPSGSTDWARCTVTGLYR